MLPSMRLLTRSYCSTRILTRLLPCLHTHIVLCLYSHLLVLTYNTVLHVPCWLSSVYSCFITHDTVLLVLIVLVLTLVGCACYRTHCATVLLVIIIRILTLVGSALYRTSRTVLTFQRSVISSPRTLQFPLVSLPRLHTRTARV